MTPGELKAAPSKLPGKRDRGNIRELQGMQTAPPLPRRCPVPCLGSVLPSGTPSSQGPECLNPSPALLRRRNVPGGPPVTSGVFSVGSRTHAPLDDCPFAGGARAPTASTGSSCRRDRSRSQGPAWVFAVSRLRLRPTQSRGSRCGRCEDRPRSSRRALRRSRFAKLSLRRSRTAHPAVKKRRRGNGSRRRKSSLRRSLAGADAPRSPASRIEWTANAGPRL